MTEAYELFNTINGYSRRKKSNKKKQKQKIYFTLRYQLSPIDSIMDSGLRLIEGKQKKKKKKDPAGEGGEEKPLEMVEMVLVVVSLAIMYKLPKTINK
jgi:hypothetical protein